LLETSLRKATARQAPNRLSARPIVSGRTNRVKRRFDGYCSAYTSTGATPALLFTPRIAVIAGTLLGLVLNPAAPQGFAAPEFLPWARQILVVSFGLGIYANLLSLGLSGWIRSRALGLVTSAAALLSGLIVWAFVRH
jgi:hypothetical protein